MPAWRWTFYDPGTDTTRTFLVNPNAGGTPAFKKTLTYVATAAPQGKTLAFQGRNEPQYHEVSGTLRSEAEYDFFVAAFDTQNQMLLTDDLGRQFWVVVIEFTPTRVRAATAPWKHTYNLRALILDVP